MNKLELQVQNEAMFLGCLLKDHTLIDEARIQPKQFVSLQNREVYKAMLDVKKEGQEISIISLAQLGESRAMKFGGSSYLSDLSNSVPSIHSFNTYQQNIQNFHTVQQAQNFANEFLESTKETYNIKELSKLIKGVTDLEARTVKKNTSFKEKMVSRMDYHYNTPKTGLSGVNTGFMGLNRVTDGWQKSDLIIVAARPSLGKTALVLNSVLEGGKKDSDNFSTIFSIEMAEGQLIDRFIASQGKINLMKMRNPNKTFSESDWDKYSRAVASLENLNIDIRSECTVPEIRAAVRRNIKEHPNKKHVVALDFLTLIKHTNPSGNKHQDVTDIIQDLKQIAKDFNVPFIVIAQLNRAVESRSDKRPNMSDLTESGSIEQIADVIALLYREDYYNKDEENKSAQDIIEINIAKNRQGSTGLVKLKFIKETNTFYDLV